MIANKEYLCFEFIWLKLDLERPKTDNSTTWRAIQDKIFKEMNITATG